MRPRVPISRILHLRPFRPPNCSRLFTHNTIPTARPILQFLSTPRPPPAPARFLTITTENKQWLKGEAKVVIKVVVIMFTIFGLVIIMNIAVNDEMAERKYNPPNEWSSATRKMYLFSALHLDDETPTFEFIRWHMVGDWYNWAITRLQDPNIDGAGLEKQVEGGILVEGIGEMGLDVSMKSEDWRRGYYVCMLGAAKAAEYMEEMVRHKVTQRVTLKQYVIGPSNPDPTPLPPDSPLKVFKEEDTEVAFPTPGAWYLRIMTTRGFTQKQYVDAAIAYAAYLEFKGSPETALEMYHWAIDIVQSSIPNESKSIINSKTGVLDTKKGLPSLNLLNISTAMGVHHASRQNLSLALPIFLSVLRARRSLPEPLPVLRSRDESPKGAWERIKALSHEILVRPPPSPPAVDGTAPPTRTPHELCNEAALMTYIGEILYASNPSVSSKEEGLAWTREAVDVSEEQITRRQMDFKERRTCKECLSVAVGNWDRMVRILATAERKERIENKGKVTGGWLGFGGKEQQPQGDFQGRWEIEEGVVADRMKRAADLFSRVGLE